MFRGLGLVFAADAVGFAVPIIGNSDSSSAAKIVLEMATAVWLFIFVGLSYVCICKLKIP